jgi:hypothetical protein
MKKLGIVLVAVVVLFSVQSANADVSIPFSDIYTCSLSVAAPADYQYTPGGQGAFGGLAGGALGFTLASAKSVSFTVTDGFLYGDVYEFFVDGAFVGQTSPVAIGDSSGGYSTGTFTVALAAGAHTFDLWDITLSYIGEDSPFGGGNVSSGYSPAGVYVSGVYAPLPASLPLFASGLLALGLPLLRRRHR